MSQTHEIAPASKTEEEKADENKQKHEDSGLTIVDETEIDEDALKDYKPPAPINLASKTMSFGNLPGASTFSAFQPVV